MQHLPQSPLAFGLESVQPNFDLIALRELIPQDRLAEFDASLKAPDSPLHLLPGDGGVDVVVGGVGGGGSSVAVGGAAEAPAAVAVEAVEAATPKA